MSLRWHLIGLDLGKLWARLGSGDESLHRSLGDDFDARVRRAIELKWVDAEEGETGRNQAHAVLGRAIREGAPFPDLQGEIEVHVEVADALARFGQVVYETESWDWKHGAWYEFERQLAPRLADPDRQLLTPLVHGRPIFGQRFDTGWSFYTIWPAPRRASSVPRSRPPSPSGRP